MLSCLYNVYIHPEYYFPAAEERAEDDFIRRKIFRRKKVYSQPPQLSPTYNIDQEVQNGYVRRKVIKPVQIALEPTIVSQNLQKSAILRDISLIIVSKAKINVIGFFFERSSNS